MDMSRLATSVVDISDLSDIPGDYRSISPRSRYEIKDILKEYYDCKEWAAARVVSSELKRASTHAARILSNVKSLWKSWDRFHKRPPNYKIRWYSPVEIEEAVRVLDHFVVAVQESARLKREQRREHHREKQKELEEHYRDFVQNLCYVPSPSRGQ